MSGCPKSKDAPQVDDTGNSTWSEPSPDADWVRVEATRIVGDEGGERFADYFDVGDADGDGVDEVVAGACGPVCYTCGHASTGGAYLFEGAAAPGEAGQSAVATLIGENTDACYGFSTAFAGDVLGDGQNAIAVGGGTIYGPGTPVASLFAAPHTGVRNEDAAAVVVYADPEDRFGGGLFLGPCGDISGDGAVDLCLPSAPTALAQTPTSGIWIWEGPLSGTIDESTVYARIIGQPDDWVAQQSKAVDFDGDGSLDLLLGGALRGGATGVVQVILAPVAAGEHSQDLLASYTWTGEASLGYAGQGVSAGGDLDGDGAADVYIGAPQLLARTGRAYVMLDPTSRSVADADVVMEARHEGDWFGYQGAIGDFDGDGVDDLAVSAPRDIYMDWDRPGRVSIFEGPITGGLLTEDDAARLLFTSDAPDAFGLRMDAGDLDGDGDIDLAVGSPVDPAGGLQAGSLTLLIDVL